MSRKAEYKNDKITLFLHNFVHLTPSSSQFTNQDETRLVAQLQYNHNKLPHISATTTTFSTNIIIIIMRFSTTNACFLNLMAAIVLSSSDNAVVHAQVRGQNSNNKRIRNSNSNSAPSYGSFYDQVDATFDSIKARYLKKDKEDPAEADEKDDDMSMSMSMSL